MQLEIFPEFPGRFIVHASRLAVLLTDTAEFRNPNYHRASGTPDTLDYARMAELTLRLAEALRGL